MVNVTNVEKWVNALESGNFEQGEGALYKDGAFCCLGVACDIAKEELGVDWVFSEEGDNVYERSKALFLGERNYLPGAVKDWLGMKYANPEVKFYDDEDDTSDWTELDWQDNTQGLSDLNDEGYSFEDIAKFIRDTYLPA